MEISIDKFYNEDANQIKMLIECDLYDVGNDNSEIVIGSIGNDYNDIMLALKEIDVDILLEDYYNMLDLACENGSINVLTTLLEVEPDYYKTDFNNINSFNSAFVTAAVNDKLDIVELLLKDKRIDLSFDMSRALHDTCAYGLLDVFKVLLADDRSDLDEDIHNAVVDACGTRHHDMVIYALDNKDINCYIHYNDLFTAACRYDQVEVVEKIIELNKIDLSNITHDTVCSSNAAYSVRVIEAIICTGESTICIESLFSASLELNRRVIAKYLIDNKLIDFAHKKGVYYDSIVKSAKFNDFVILNSLLDMSHHAIIPYSIFIRACKLGSIDLVKKLLADDRLDMCSRDNEALSMACISGKTDLVEILLNEDRIILNTNLYDIIHNVRSISVLELLRKVDDGLYELMKELKALKKDSVAYKLIHRMIKEKVLKVDSNILSDEELDNAYSMTNHYQFNSN